MKEEIIQHKNAFERDTQADKINLKKMTKNNGYFGS